MDEFDDSFNELAYCHSTSNSDSGFVASRNSEERPTSQSANQNWFSEAKKSSLNEGKEMTELKQSLLDHNMPISVEYETRDGTAKQGAHFDHQQGTIVSFNVTFLFNMFTCIPPALKDCVVIYCHHQFFKGVL